MSIVYVNLVKRIIDGFRFFFFFTGPGILYHWWKKQTALKRLELYAVERRIKRELTSSLSDFGELHWELDGRPIVARICYDNPSSGPWISVGLKLNERILRLHTCKPMTRSGEGWEEFKSPDSAFNYLYKSRVVKSNYRNALLGSPFIFEEIVKFYSHWALYLSSDIGTNGLVVTGEIIRFTFGPSMIRSFFPYITPEEIEAVLPDLLELAESFDKVFQADRNGLHGAFGV